MSVLVTPGNLRTALAITRSLGRRGISVTIADERAKSIGGGLTILRGANPHPKREKLSSRQFISRFVAAVTRLRRERSS